MPEEVTAAENRRVIDKFITKAAKDSAKDIGQVVGKHSAEAIGAEVSESFKDIKKVATSPGEIGEVVGRHSAEVMGAEMSSAFQDVRKITTSLFSFGRGLFTRDKEKKSEEIMKDTNENIEKLVPPIKGTHDILRERAKEEAREPVKKKVERNLLLPILAGLGLLIGGLARSFLLPFETLWMGLNQVFRIGKFFGFVGTWLAKLPGVGKLVMVGEKGLTAIGKIFRWIGGILTRTPLIGTLFKGILKGFRILGWPIQIVLSLIDFIKGFRETEGTLLEKIIGGLEAAVLGFLDLPLRAIGWITDKVLGFFGVEIEGGAGQALIDGAKMLLDNIFTFLKWPFETLWGIIQPIWENIKALFEGDVTFTKIMDLLNSLNPINWMGKILSRLLNAVSEIFDFEMIWSKFKKFIWDNAGTVGRQLLPEEWGAAAEPEVKRFKIGEAGEAIPVQEMEAEKMKQAEIAKRRSEEAVAAEKRRQKDMEALRKTTETAAAEQTGQLQLINTNVQQAGTPAEASEIPSEPENFVLGLAVGGMI